MNHEGWGLIRVFSKQRLMRAVGMPLLDPHLCCFEWSTDGNVMVFIKVKSPEPCHSLAYIHNHCTQKSNQIVANKIQTQAIKPQFSGDTNIKLCPVSVTVMVKLSHTRSDNFPAVPELTILGDVYENASISLYYQPKLTMCTFTHTSENNLNPIIYLK